LKKLIYQGFSFNASDTHIEITEMNTPSSVEYYFLSNDGISIKNFKGSNKDDMVYIGVGNPDWLHVLAGFIDKKINLKKLIAFDINPWQIVHLRNLINIIKSSQNRKEFVENLFCISLNEKANELLDKTSSNSAYHVPGCGRGTGLIKQERMIWANSSFDKKLFWQKHKLKTTFTETGLKIYTNTIGGFKEYFATVFCVDSNCYQGYPFGLRFGHGYLANEKIFQQVKKVISSLELYLILADVTDFINLIYAHRYERLGLWVSNLFVPFFMEKEYSLKKAESFILNHTGKKKSLPELDLFIVTDKREYTPLSRIKGRSLLQRFKFSPHTKTFSVLNKLMLPGYSLEIVNVKCWIEEDNGESKLPNTDYIMPDEYLGKDAPWATNIIFHILLGHDLPLETFKPIFNKAQKYSKRIIVVEHNPGSIDFILRSDRLKNVVNGRLLPTPDEIIYVPGVLSQKRNVILKYDMNHFRET
jgi:hypothetical protein